MPGWARLVGLLLFWVVVGCGGPDLLTVDPAMVSFRTFIKQRVIDRTSPNWRTHLPGPPSVTFEPTHRYFWVLETNKGILKIQLMEQLAPAHVGSTLYLTMLGYYDTLTFHRVIPGFVAQGGCPLGNGTGEPGYRYSLEVSPSVKHDRAGLLSMANKGPGTEGSQFFLTFAPAPQLDGLHSIFGEVKEGMEVLKALEKAGTAEGRPSEPLFLRHATISIEKIVAP